MASGPQGHGRDLLNLLTSFAGPVLGVTLYALARVE